MSILKRAFAVKDLPEGTSITIDAETLEDAKQMVTDFSSGVS